IDPVGGPPARSGPARPIDRNEIAGKVRRREVEPMGQPYVGEIRMFGGSFAPAGWALCQGQLMPISENDVLFNLIGTTYGGDGQETFGIPDLPGRPQMHQGTGAGQTYVIGEKGGV